MFNWFLSLSIRWKLQLGFFLVTMVTTIYNRMLASHELGTMVEIARQGGVAEKVIQALEGNHSAYVFNSFWESGLEFALQFMLIGVVANLFVRPIQALCRALNAVEEGDLTQGVPNTARDEIGVLERSFNSMLDRINHIMRGIDHSSKQMGLSAYQITTLSQEIAEISQREQRRSTDVNQATGRMRDISEAMQRQADVAREQASNTETTARQGIAAVQANIQGMEQTAQEVHRASGEIQILDQSADQIGHIVESIQGLAERTNLLALNAAIEAARAGEAGRGFAVVADEVRKLAERTTDSAQEIAAIIQTLTRQVKQAAGTMDKVVEQVHGSQNQAAETSAMIEEMARVVSGTVRTNKDISSASAEQMAQFRQMDETLGKLFNTLGENAAKVRTTADISDALYGVTEDMKKLLAGFVFDKASQVRTVEQEKRAFPRTGHSLRVDAQQGGHKQEGLTRDISLSGLRLALNRPLDDADAELRLSVYLPYEDRTEYGNQIPLSLAGKVAWSKKDGEYHLYGIHFHDVDDRARDSLRRCIQYFNLKAEY